MGKSTATAHVIIHGVAKTIVNHMATRIQSSRSDEAGVDDHDAENSNARANAAYTRKAVHTYK